jgi:hypothetical protein
MPVCGVAVCQNLPSRIADRECDSFRQPQATDIYGARREEGQEERNRGEDSRLLPRVANLGTVHAGEARERRCATGAEVRSAPRSADRTRSGGLVGSRTLRRR